MTIADLIESLIVANLKTWALKDDQAAAVKAGKTDEPDLLLGYLAKDLQLCEARASLRAEINMILGDKNPDASVLKRYGKH